MVIIVPVHFGNYISYPTSMQCASKSELDIVVIWIGFGDRLAFESSTVKNNLLPFNKIDVRSNFFGADFPEEVFPLSKH